MAYQLLNIETLECYYCDDKEWMDALETAKENYWEPDGTTYDLFYNIEEICSDSEDILDYHYALMISKDEAARWDGNYTDKCNQVVIQDDAVYLAFALDGTDVNIELIDFMKKGSFRICSE